MKVAVTGANGFLAGYIVKSLVDNGFEVIGIVRKSADLSGLKQIPLTIRYGNITDYDDVLKLLKEIDIVVHVAAETSPNADKDAYQLVNVTASEYILKSAIANSCKRIFYVSTANTIGYGDNDYPGNETLNVSKHFKRSGYAKSKMDAENRFLSASAEKLIEVVVLNPTFMIGYDERKSSSSKIFGMFLNSNPLFYPSGGKNFVYVEDVAKAVCNSIHLGRDGERYLLAGHNLSYKEFFTWVSKISGVRKIMIKIPSPLLLLSGYIGSVLKLLGIRVQLNYTNARILTIRNYYTPQKSVEELKLNITPIETSISEGLRSYVK